MKDKTFGNCKVFEYSHGIDSRLKPGIAVNIGWTEDEWIRLSEAKKLAANLLKAIAYIEKQAEDE